jgi:hypothetical protein
MFGLAGDDNDRPFDTLRDFIDPRRDANPPVTVRTALTGHCPWVMYRSRTSAGETRYSKLPNDYNRPARLAERDTQQIRFNRFTRIMENDYGIRMRDNQVPIQCRFNNPGTTGRGGRVNGTTLYSTNGLGQHGQSTHSCMLRWSTHLFHTVDEIDQVGSVFSIQNLKNDPLLVETMVIRQVNRATNETPLPAWADGPLPAWG